MNVRIIFFWGIERDLGSTGFPDWSTGVPLCVVFFKDRAGNTVPGAGTAVGHQINSLVASLSVPHG